MRVMELHSPVKLIQRSKGQSATAAAAYRSGSKIYDERTGETHDYTRKKGIEFESLLFPMDTPEHIEDRQSLWNAAELKENRKNSQTARDLEISFPAEFSFEQRREAGLTIGSLLVDRYGVAADLCWHQPSKKGDERNFHLHVLFTTRTFENGDWSKTKDRALDDIYGTGKDEILGLRQGIADVLNNIAARDGVQVYVEHLSFEKRGIDKEATQHLGHSATELERKGIKTEIGNHNREIQKRNEERQKLYEQQKAVNMEIKTAVSHETQSQPVKSPSETPKFSPQMRESDFFKGFYRETQTRRLDLLEGLKRQYGEQEKASRQELAQVFNQASRGGFVGFWRNITGQTKKDQEQIRRLQENLENIQKQKREAFQNFERDRQARLEILKKQEQQKQTEQIPANENQKLIELETINKTIKARQKSQSRQQSIDFDRD